MTPELSLLGLAVVLGLLQILVSAQAANLQRGYRWGASARDEPRPPLTGLAGRLERAFRNFMETFPLFAAAVLIAHLAGRSSWMTVWGAHLYVWARVAYAVLYAAGIPYVRSLAWNVATLGIVLILLALVVEP
jgi:uncharacterized MAPEG superfamily protein